MARVPLLLLLLKIARHGRNAATQREGLPQRHGDREVTEAGREYKAQAMQRAGKIRKNRP
jgi:hypothetical protein